MLPNHLNDCITDAFNVIILYVWSYLDKSKDISLLAPSDCGFFFAQEILKRLENWARAQYQARAWLAVL